MAGAGAAVVQGQIVAATAAGGKLAGRPCPAPLSEPAAGPAEREKACADGKAERIEHENSICIRIAKPGRFSGMTAVAGVTGRASDGDEGRRVQQARPGTGSAGTVGGAADSQGREPLKRFVIARKERHVLDRPG